MTMTSKLMAMYLDFDIPFEAVIKDRRSWDNNELKKRSSGIHMLESLRAKRDLEFGELDLN